MAKKVNKKFVIILGASLVSVAAIGASAVLYNRYKPRDPNVLRHQAEEFEKKGELVRAVEYYGYAADASSRAKAIGTDQLLLKMSDAAMEVSRAAKNPAEGVRFYQISRAALQRALTENPNNRQVNERLLEESYQIAKLDQSPGSWTSLEEAATRFLQNAKDPAAKHFLYRAEARLRWVQLVSTKDVPESRFAAIEEDLKKAAALDTQSSKTAALVGEFNWIKSMRAKSRGAGDDAKKLLVDAQNQMKAFLEKHPNDPDVTEVLASSIVYQANEIREDISRPPAERAKAASPFLANALAVVKAAYAANPGHVRLGELLATLYLAGNLPEQPRQPERAEAVFKELIAAHPDSAEGYVRLARYYEINRETRKAIDEYKNSLAHSNTGGGLESIKNDEFQRRAFAAIASLTLDLVEPGKEETPEGKALLEEAAANIEKLKASHGMRGQIDLLDARVQLKYRNLPQAAALLHSAETNLKNSPYFADQYRQTLVLLAETNLMQNPPQLGGALQYLDDALALQPGNIQVILQRAQVLNRLTRFSDAQAAMDSLLKVESSLPPKVAELAKSILATAKTGMGDRASAIDIYNKIDNARALVQLAWTNVANGDYEAAAEAADRALAKEPDNIEALRIAAISNARLERKDQALKYAERGLSKFPRNADFEMIKSSLTQEAPNSPEAQQKILSAITDPYIRNLQLATLYRQRGDSKNEIESLKAAEASIGDVSTADGRQKQSELVDRIFSAYAGYAVMATDAAVRNDLWKGAESYVQKAEKFNVDGVNGKLYRGRFDLMRTNGASGLQTIEQAVAQRADYAYGHGILGQAYLGANRPDAALEEFRTAIRLSPNNINYILRAVDILVRRGDARGGFDEAKDLLRQGAQFAPRDQRLAQYNDIFADNDKTIREKAIKTREEIAKSQPANLANLQRLALLYVRNKDDDPRALEKAVALIRPLYVKDKTNIEYIAQLANIYAEQNLADEGVRLFETVTASSDTKQRYEGLIVLGEFCRRVGRNDQAAASFREAIKIKPENNDDADRHLADMYFDIDDMANAETAYQSIVANAKPGAARNLAVRRLIETQIRQKKFVVAEEMLAKEILKDQPKDPQGLVLRAYSRIQQGREKEAIADLDAVLAENRDYPDALYYRALAQFNMRGNLEQAISDLLTVRKRDRTAINARILLTQVYRYSRRFAEAANEYEEILKDKPDQLTVRRDYAQFLMDLAGVSQKLGGSSDDFAMAIRRLKPIEKLQDLLRDSMSRYPQQVTWPLMSAELSALVGNTREAQLTYERAYRNMPEEPGIVNLYLKSLLQTKNYEEALAVATKAIARRPEILDYYIRRAHALAALKRVSEAGNDIDRALGLAIEACKQSKEYETYLTVVNQAGESVGADLLAARLQVRIGADPDEYISTIALIHMLTVANRAPDALSIVTSARVPMDNKPLRYMFTKEAGMVYYQLKQYPEGAKAFEEALAFAPNDVEVLNNYAFLLADGLNRPKDALPLIDRAQKTLNAAANPAALMANTANIADTYGWVKFLAGDSAGAIVELRRAIQSQPLPVIYLHLAQVFKKEADLRPADREMNLKNARDAVSEGLRAATDKKDPAIADLEKLQKDLAPKPGAVR